MKLCANSRCWTFGSLIVAVILIAALAVLFVWLARKENGQQRYWWAEVDHGDKPTVGWLLSEKDGEIRHIDFSVLAPEGRVGAPREGKKYPAKIISRSGDTYEIEIDLTPAAKPRRLKLKTAFPAEAQKIQAELHSGAVTETIEFARVDQRAKRMDTTK